MLLTRRRPALLVVAALLAGSSLSACTTTVGGSGRMAVGDFFTPSASPTASAEVADDLVRRARNVLMLGGDVAVDGTSEGQDVSLHVTGRYSFDGCSAIVRVGTLRLEVREVADEVFVQAPNAFWATMDDVPGAAAVTSEQWVLVEDPLNWPAFFGTTAYVESVVLPDSSLDLDTAGEATPGGEHAVLVDDEDGWEYTILDQVEDPRVVHVEQDDDGSAYDVTYPTDDVAFVAPARDLVVSLEGF